MHDIFLSYSASEDDSALVQAISDRFPSETGLRIWKFEDEIDSRQRVDKKVKDAIRSSQALLVLYTRDASQSHWVQGELSFARELPRTIIFCQARDVDDQSIPIQFQDMDRIKFNTAEDLLAKLRTHCRIVFGIPVVIPAAGEGGGLYPISMNMPKALIPVGDKPMLHHIIMNVDSPAFSKVYVLVSAKRFKPMFDYYVDILRPRVSIPVEVVASGHTHVPMAIKFLMDAVPIKGTFLLHYSDIVLGSDPDWSWARLVASHQLARTAHARLIATLAVSPYYPLPIGVVRQDEFNPNLIKSFQEKPREWTEVFNRYVNTAVTLLEPDIAPFIQEGDKSFYGDCLARAINDPGSWKVAFVPLRNWHHIQTIGDWWNYQESSFPIR